MPPLFHPRAINKALQAAAFPEDIQQRREVIAKWAAALAEGRLDTLNETSLQGEFVHDIFHQCLGFRSPVHSEGAWEVKREEFLSDGGGRADAALGFFTATTGRVVAPVELKGVKDPLDRPVAGRRLSAVEQGWRYANYTPGCRWVLVSNYREIRLYHTAKTPALFEAFQVEKLTDPALFRRFFFLLCRENFLPPEDVPKLPSRLDALMEESDEAGEEITRELYGQYHGLRLALIGEFAGEAGEGARERQESQAGRLRHQQQPSTLDPLSSIERSQKLLDRTLFIAFAEDNGLLPTQTFYKAVSFKNPYFYQPPWQNLKAVFRGIDKGNPPLGIPGYNGGLFRDDPVLDAPDFLVSDQLCRRLEELTHYDYSTEVPVEVLGHIFEQSITDLEELKAQALGQEPPKRSGKRKAHGVYYTPAFVTRFIVDQALGGYLREQEKALRQRFGVDESSVAPSAKRLKQEIAFWKAYRDEVLGKTRVLDPACGSGAFLIAAFDALLYEYTRVNEILFDLEGTRYLFELNASILTQNLFGVDLSPESVEITKLSLWIKTAERGKALTDLDANILCGDSLIEDGAFTERPFDWQKAFPRVFEAGGFDVVIGNPPYVRQEFLSARKPYLEQHYEVYHGVGDLYTYFFERGQSLLKPGGRLGYISSSTFFKTGSGENLRQFLGARTTIRSIVDFGDLQLFEEATNYPAIIVVEKTPPPQDHEVRFMVVKEIPEEDLAPEFKNDAESIPQSRLVPSGWKLEGDALARLRAKIVAGKPTLKEVYGSPYRGVLTGLNEAFVIDGETRKRLIAEDPNSEAIIKPFLEGKDLKRWHVEPRDRWLIFTRRGIDIEQYPAIKRHLEHFRERLEPKPEGWEGVWPGRKPGDYKWYEIQDTIGYFERFGKPKVLYPDICQFNKFCFDQRGYYFGNTVYFQGRGDWCLAAFLNSRLLWFYWLGIANAIRGGFLRFFSQFVERTPIPVSTEGQKSALAALSQRCQEVSEARYKVEEEVRRRIPDLCPQGHEAKLTNRLLEWWDLDFKGFLTEIKKVFKADVPVRERSQWEDWLGERRAAHRKLTEELAALEEDLNRQVYALFDLTEEDIRLLEGSI